MSSFRNLHPGRRLAAPLLLAALANCGGSSDGGGGPDEPVLTTVTVTPSTASIYNTAPGNTVNLLVLAKDQNEATLTGVSPTFTSGSTGVATVSATGTVTAVAAGTAQISVSVNHGGVTLTEQVPINVRVPPSVASVGSSPIPQPSFVPATVHIAGGGDVIWSLSGPEHSVTFISNGAPASIPSLINASASRTFPTAGTYSYLCDFHPTMSGTVYVH